MIQITEVDSILFPVLSGSKTTVLMNWVRREKEEELCGNYELIDIDIVQTNF